MIRKYNTKVADTAGEYKGHTIWKATPNASGIKYYAYTDRGIIRADTLAGIKRLIKK